MTKGKWRIIRFLTVILSACALIIPIANIQKAQAADITSSEVNSITTNIGQAKPGQRITFTMTFGNSSKVIHTGDTIHVTFPEATDTAAGIQGIPHQIPVKYNNPSDPGDPLNGQTIATADITTTGVTITFNSKMNGHILTSGSLSFTGQVVTKKGTNPTKINTWPNMGNVPVPSIHVSQTITSVHTPNVGQGGTPNIVAPTGHVKKSGVIANNGNINWQVHGVLGDPGTTTITDTMKDGQTLVPGSIKITFFIQYQDGQWGTAHFAYNTKTYPVSEGKITETSNGFTITANQYNIAGALMGVDESGNQGDVKQVAYTITYQSKLSSTEQNDQWTNSVKQTNPDGSDGGSTTSDVKNSWQATANGTQPKNGIKLQKVTTNNGQTIGLSGATFELSGNGKNETAVSNAAGIIEFNNLTAGTYTIKETKAPKGYSLNNEVINVTIDDQGKTTLTVNGKDISDNARVVDTLLASSSSSSSSSSSKSSSHSSSSSKKSSSSSIKSSSLKESSSSSKKSSSSSVKSSSLEGSSSKKSSSSSIKSSPSKVSSSSSKKSSSSSVKSSTVKSSVIDGSSSKESSVVVPSKPDASASMNGNGVVVPSKPDTNMPSKESSVVVPSKPDTNASSNGNGGVTPSRPDANTSSNGNGAIVPSKPDASASMNGNGGVTPNKPDANSSMNGNGGVTPNKPVVIPSSNVNGNSTAVLSKTDTPLAAESNGTNTQVSAESSKKFSSSSSKNMNNSTNNLKSKNGKDLPQTGDVSHTVAVIMGAITLVIAGIISLFKRDDD